MVSETTPYDYLVNSTKFSLPNGGHINGVLGFNVKYTQSLLHTLKRKPVFSRKYDVISLSELRNTSGVEEYLVGKETIH